MPTEIAAMLAALILVGLICFQLLLAAGLPMGHYAWGGAHRVLPRPLRIGSVVTTVIYLFAGLVILEAASITELVVSSELTRNAVWVLAVFFGIGVVMNAISRSRKERLMSLVAASLCVLCAIVALGV